MISVKIVVSVKMPIPAMGRKDPVNLYYSLAIDLGHPMCRIGRRL